MVKFSSSDQIKLANNDYLNWDAEQLYEYGLSCSDDAWDSDIYFELMMRHDPKYIYLAGKNWDPDRLDNLWIYVGRLKEPEYIYLAGRDWDDEAYGYDGPNNFFVTFLLAERNAEYIYKAGRDWKDSRYSPVLAYLLYVLGSDKLVDEARNGGWPEHRAKDILLSVEDLRDADSDDLYNFYAYTISPEYLVILEDEALKRNDPKLLYLVGRKYDYIPTNRSMDEIRNALISTGNSDMLLYAVDTWHDEYVNDALRNACLNSSNSEELYKIGLSSTHTKFPPYSLRNALIRRGDGHYLCEAGKNWDDDLYSPDIGYALVSTGQWGYVRNAEFYWPEHRKKDLTHMPDLGIYKGPGMNEDIPKNASVDESIKLAEEANFHSDWDAQQLYEFGLTCEDAEWNVHVFTELLNRGDPKYIYLAGKNWDPDRFCGAWIAIYRLKDPKYIYLAGKNWDDEALKNNELSNTFVICLLAERNVEYVYKAGRDWKDSRYSPVLAYMLSDIGSDDLINDALNGGWPENRASDILLSPEDLRDGCSADLYTFGMFTISSEYLAILKDEAFKRNDAELLYLAGQNNVYSTELGSVDETKHALIATGDAEMLRQAVWYWPDHYVDDTLREACLKSLSACKLYSIGLHDLRGKITPYAFRNALINKGDAQYLYMAGKDWDNSLYSSNIGYALFGTGNEDFINKAKEDWPEDRRNDITHIPDLSIYKDPGMDEGIPTHASFDESIKLAEESNHYSDWDDQQLFNFGLTCEDDEWDDRIRDELIERRSYLYLQKAGEFWNDERYDDSILWAITDSDDAELLYNVGNLWESDRYDDSVAYALIKTENAEFLCKAGENWFDDLYNEDILKALIATNDLEWIYEAGNTWGDNLDDEAYALIVNTILNSGEGKWIYRVGRGWGLEDISRNIAEILAETRQIPWLIEAGKHWKDDVYDPIIGKTISAKGSQQYIDQALEEWPKRRKGDLAPVPYDPYEVNTSLNEDIPINASDESNKPTYQDFLDVDIDTLYSYALNCSKDDWDPLIIEAFFERGELTYLAALGDELDDDKYDDRILEIILDEGYAGVLYDVGRWWPSERYDDRVRVALIETGNAEFLCRAGLDWENDLYNEDILEALINTYDLEWLYEAGNTWDALRYDDRILETILDYADGEWIYKVGIEWSTDITSWNIAEVLADTLHIPWLIAAGRDWDDSVYDPVIGVALFQIGSQHYIDQALAEWPKHRRKDLLLEPVDLFNNALKLDEDIPKSSSILWRDITPGTRYRMNLTGKVYDHVGFDDKLNLLAKTIDEPCQIFSTALVAPRMEFNKFASVIQDARS